MQFKIGILGEARAGKDTVADLIERALISDRVKSNIPHLYAFTFSSGIHELLRAYIPGLYKQGKPRDALQRVGQLLREYDPAVWINRLFNSGEYIYAQQFGHNIVITDVRQPNEAQALMDKGFIIIKVTAKKADRIDRMRAEGDSFNVDNLDHETEQSVHSCVYDYEITNNGTLEELEAKVVSLLEQIAGSTGVVNE